MAKKKLSQKELDSLLKGINRSMKLRDIESPIVLSFGENSGGCWRRECETTPDRGVRCRWVRVPC